MSIFEIVVLSTLVPLSVGLFIMSECVKALREAQQVAFDMCMAQRDSINA